MIPRPSDTCLVKIGSAIVHADEFTSPKGNPVDLAAFRDLLNDPEVKTWLEAMNELALLPVKR